MREIGTKNIEDLSEKEKEEVRRIVESDLNAAINEVNKMLRSDLAYMISDYQFFARLSQRMIKVFDYVDVDLAAVNIINGQPYLYINPLRYLNTPKRERIGTLIHELMHIALNHIDRYMRLPNMWKHHYTWNQATDLFINQRVPNTSRVGLPPGVLYPEVYKKYGIELPPDKSANVYYKILMENFDKLPQNLKSGFGEAGKDEGEGEKDTGWHKSWSKSKGSIDGNREAIRKIVSETLNATAGTLPANLRREIREAIKSEIPWTRELSNITAKYLRDKIIPTNKRENRRLPGILKGKRKLKKKVVLFIADTSASVSDEHLAQANGHIHKLWRSGVKVYIMSCDTEVSEIVEYKGRMDDIKYTGNGGTSFIPPFEKIMKEKLEIDCVIYQTDGYGKAMDKCPIPTIWCITPDGTIPTAVSGGHVKWGKIIRMN